MNVQQKLFLDANNIFHFCTLNAVKCLLPMKNKNKKGPQKSWQTTFNVKTLKKNYNFKEILHFFWK